MEEKEIVQENSFDAILGKDIVKKLLEKTDVDLSKEEIQRLEKEAVGSVDFMSAIEKIEIPKDNYVIFTDGDEQLLYENGEFYIISTLDNPKRRKKKTKKEATDMYLNYFIKYTLNPILDKRDEEKELVAKKQKKEPKREKVVAEKSKEKLMDNIKEKKELVKSAQPKTVDKELEL